MRGGLFLLFLWMTGMEDALAKDKCSFTQNGRCLDGQMCATINESPEYFACVKQEQCVGQSKGKCPDGQSCRVTGGTAASPTFGCKSKEAECSATFDTCPSHQSCTEKPVITFGYCADRVLCGGTTNGYCPDGQFCYDYTGNEDSFSCEQRVAEGAECNILASDCPVAQSCKTDYKDNYGTCHYN